jgi:lactoylglutathione lyase
MKFLHTLLRAHDLDKSLAFYNKVLELKPIRRNEFPYRKYMLVFLGYGMHKSDIFLELTYNWGERKYEIGNGFGHIAFEIPDLITTCTKAIEYSGTVTRELGVLKTSSGENVAFVTDPDGYSIELIESL